MAIGRISGPLLKSNLIRDGVDLAFETDLLYLDVVNGRIGINKVAPTTDLDVNGTTKTVELIVNDRFDTGNISIYDNTISSTQSTISFEPAVGEPTIYHSKLQVDDIQITGNTISTNVLNSNLEFQPNGNGTVEILSNTNITGDLFVSGNINAVGNVVIGGNITIGNESTDNIVINASIKSDLIPETTNTYDLGSVSFRWRTVYANQVYSDTLNVPTLDIGNLMFRDNEITTTTGQDLFIDGNGTGGVRLGNFRIVDNVITNISVNAITQIAQSGTGYFKIEGSNGFVPPRGTNLDRPTEYAVVGMTRYNITARALEIWDGIGWASPAGSLGAVTELQANQLAAEFALILG
jgi:hypothetical protein